MRLLCKKVVRNVFLFLWRFSIGQLVGHLISQVEIEAVVVHKLPGTAFRTAQMLHWDEYWAVGSRENDLNEETVQDRIKFPLFAFHYCVPVT